MPNPPPRVTRGYLYAFLAAICGGAIPTLSKVLLTQAGPVTVSGLSFFISGLMILPFQARSLPTRISAKYVAFFGVIGACIAPVLYQIGLDSTTAVNTALLSNAEGLFTTLIAFIAFGERLARRQLARGLLIVAGIVLVSTNLDLAHVQFLEGLAGNLLILAAMFLWSLENNLIISAAQRFGPLLVTKFRNVIGGGIVTVAVILLGTQVSLSPFGIVALVLLGVSLAGTSYLAIAALADAGAIRAILVFSTTSVFGAAFALIFLGEQITVVQLAGGALIMAGVYALHRSESRSAHL